MSTSITTALTIIGSFGAASTAQIVSHILTQKREDKKYKKECLQNLYSPIVFKLINYIEYEGKNHSPLLTETYDSSNLFKEVTKCIGNNLKYADVDLINIYQEILGSQSESEVLEFYRWSNTDISDEEMTSRITLINIFFTQFLEINKALKSNSQFVDEKLKTPYFFTHFYLLIKECLYYYEGVSSAQIFEMYDLIETTFYQINNFTERVIEIRKELYSVMYTSLYKDNLRVRDAYLSAYQFLYEFVDEFSYFSEERASEWKDLLDENIHDL
jgi:hypothetical protein